MFHRWTIFEDIVVCVYAVNRKSDPKTVEKIALWLGIDSNRVAYRMCNYVKLLQGKYKNWHYSRQEKKVFDWVTSCGIVSMKPVKI
jgi:hypothetical protein